MESNLKITSTNQMAIESHDSGSITEVQVNAEHAELVLNHTLFSAKVSLFGGQVLSWQPKGQSEVFWVSKNAILNGDKPIRGGIPLCWPWFGSYKDAGNHGFARTNYWHLKSSKISKDGILLELELTVDNQCSQWPYSFSLIQVLEFSSTLKQQLIVENTSDQTFDFSYALHSYFSVSSPNDVKIPDLSSANYDNKITQLINRPPADVLDCVGPIDNIYHSDKSLTLFDKKWKRAIEINKANSAQWVLWNPGEEGAKSFNDIHQNGEQEFVCLEAANTHFLQVAAGQIVNLSQEIKVYKL
ncbi:D-hexose-6-phosphate mutarotase [Thalassotalea crassostreae]|uniref:D-hexose-6-phosphate mutarotase n=1 Tax=Thalassotalea crassostreae TaxID=1763536 RepID=UPI0009EDF804|nr:D-hexose-6-phosphate mutarotase [Thalassotalea crassostreae]